MNSSVIEKNKEKATVVPPQDRKDLNSSFNEDSSSPFGAVDSNLAEWLPKKFDETSKISVGSGFLLEPLNNQELIDALGGNDDVIKNHPFSPSQIRYIVDQQLDGEAGLLLVNGFSNLFFVFNNNSNTLFLVGVVWDKSIKKWVPYIYRLRNLYRAWSRGNQIFVRD